MKTLIVYYSYTGKTELVANILARELGADLRRVEDNRRRSKFAAYVFGSLDAIRGKKTAIKTVDSSLEGYALVVVCSPVWANSPAPAMNTFVANTDFAGKRTAVLVTSGDREAHVALEKFAALVKERGARVERSFSVHTNMISELSITGRTKEIAKILKQLL